MVDFTKRENRVAATEHIQSAPQPIQTATYDQGLRSYMLRVYNTMATGLGLTGLIAYATYASGLYIQLRMAMIPLMIAEVVLVIYLSARINRVSEGAARAMFFTYSALNGLTFSVLFAAYTSQSIATVFFITAAMFGSMSLWGYVTKRDLTGMGQFMMMGLFGIIIASLVNLFLHSPGIYFATSILSVVIFTGLTAYDTQKIRNTYYQVGQADLGKAAIMGALALYLDFINLMITMLRFFGDRR